MQDQREEVLKRVRRIADSMRDSGARLEEMAAAIENWTDTMGNKKRMSAAQQRIAVSRTRTLKAVEVMGQMVAELQLLTETLEKLEGQAGKIRWH